MAIIGSYSFGSASATGYSTLDELLTQLPDNSAGLINAQDVRDSVYSLWERISGIETIALTAASASTGVIYNTTTPTLISVGGITAGSIFTNQTTQNMWNNLLYPHLAPTASISIVGSDVREFGNLTTINLNWNVYRTSYDILFPAGGIAVNGVNVISTGQSQAGVAVSTSTHSSSILNPIQYQTFTVSVTDGTKSSVGTCSLTWKTRIYWGRVDFSSIGNPNLTLNPGSFSICTPLVSDTVIKNLSGASANGMADVVGMGNELSTTKDKTYLKMDGSGNYLVFAWPTIVSGSTEPKFQVNGVESTAFTRLRNNSSFSNQYSYTGLNYEVWVTNTRQWSPIDITIS
jgi:hypothetical protein